MLQLVLGRSGSGKSSLLLDQAVAAAKEGQRVLVVVPEQFSFETERKLLAQLHGSCTLRVSVLSFSRLCENIFRSLGSLAGQRLTDMAKLALMKLAIREVGDSLELYARQSRRSDFVTTMLQTVEELKSSGTYPERLTEAGRTLQDSQLRAKLLDIGAIYRVYQGMIDQSYQDPLDDLSRAVQLVRGGDFFAGQAVFVDGFSFFSPPERALLEVMLEQCAIMTVALCADGLGSGGELDLFGDQKAAARWLVQRSGIAGVPCKKPVVLTQNHRAQNETLARVEEFLAMGEADPVSENQGLCITAAGDKYEEVRLAAARIAQLVREEDYRYREIAVVCRTLSDYQTALETILPAYDIPVFMDQRQPVTARPLFAMLLAALEAVRGEWKTESMLRIARCPGSGVPLEQSAALENYAYIWSLQGSAWGRPFTALPGGLADERRDMEAERESLAELEALRRRLVEPLADLRSALRDCTGGGFAMAVYQYMQQSGLLTHLASYCRSQPDSRQQLQETDTLYDNLIDILDLFQEAMGEVRLPAADLVELFAMAVDCLQLGQIPNTQDQTLVGSADRVRLDSPRAVFVLGVGEGIFPAKYQPYGIFSDAERETLVERGVELSASRFQRALLERFFLYSALCAPRQRLYVSYSVATLGGAQQEPSLVVGQLAALAPGAVCRAEDQPSELFVTDRFTAREQYLRGAAQGQPDRVLTAALEAEGDRAFLEQMTTLAAALPAQPISRATAEAMIKGRLSLSPTKIENYYQCPYLYFCNSMLRLRRRKRVEYGRLESGSAIHYVLEQLLRQMDSKGLATLSDEELTALLRQLLGAYLQTVVTDTATLESRFQYQFQRLTAVLLLLVRQLGEDFSQSLFTPVGMEVQVAPQGDVKPRTFTLQNGTLLEVMGKIDRVDLFVEGQHRYVRVVDYKSGNKSFRLEEVFHGLNMQMLVYLFAICEDKASRFGTVEPAGVLYMPGKVSPAELLPGQELTLARELIGSSLQMKGLLLEDEQVLRAMERELEGRYIPVRMTKKGDYSKGAPLQTADQFQHLRQAVDSRITEMGESLTEGLVAPMPVRAKGLNPCDYCDYGLLCGNKNTGRCRDITTSEAGEEENSDG